jgi:hypothetical protein
MYKQQLPVIYMSSNNFGHLISKTITTLQHFAKLHHTSPTYTSLNLSTLRLISFTLHYPHISLIIEQRYLSKVLKIKTISMYVGF